MHDDFDRWKSYTRRLAAKWFYKSGLNTPNPEASGVVEFNDLYHEGIAALYACRQKYKPELNVPFWGYARFRVEGAIVDYLRRPLVRVMPGEFNDFKKLRNAHEKLCNEKKSDDGELREPNDEELAAETGFSIERIHQIRQLDHQYEEAGENLQNPKFSAERIYVLMEECMKQLSEKEKKVFIRMYFHPDILEKLAGEMGVSRETIRRLKNKAVKKIRACLSKKGIEITDA